MIHRPLSALLVPYVLFACSGKTIEVGRNSEESIASDENAPAQEGDGYSAKTVATRRVTFTGGRISHGNAVLGDVDGDGLDDILLLDFARDEHDGNPPGVRGAAYLFYGRPKFPENVSVDVADAVFLGAGERVAAPGDVDGDGYADFAFTSADGVHVLYGGSKRLSGEHLSRESGSLLTMSSSDEAFNVTAAGDVNGDGLGDLLATVRPDYSPRPATGANDSIRTFLILGRRERLPRESALSDADAIFTGASGALRIALEAATAGDVDGDGFDDLLIGLQSTEVPETGLGIGLYYGGTHALVGDLGPGDANVVFSGPTLWATIGKLGDLDDDGFSDFALAHDERVTVVYGAPQRDLASLHTSFIVHAEGTATREDGGTSAAYLAGLASGDIDGNGAEDLIIGDPHQPGAYGVYTGAVYALLDDGERRIGDWQLGPHSALWYGRTLKEGKDANLGYGLSSGGDVNADGYEDFLVGSKGFSSGSAHYVFLVLGGPRL